MDRIARILNCQTDELELDKSKLDDLPSNPDDCMFLAAECFRNTLIEIGMGEESAETARMAFLTIQRGPIEET